MLKMAQETGVFTITPPGPQEETPGHDGNSISIDDLQNLFDKIDFNQNGKLDVEEFMLVAGDRKLILSRQNIE